jgi:hypothetical protein
MSVGSTIEHKPLAPFQPFAPRTGMPWSNVDEAIAGLKALVDAGPGASGVTAGAYGSASAVATFTVGADGRLTVAGSTAIQIAISAVTGLQAALDAKAAAVHSHAIADVTGLQAALDAKASATDLSNHLADTSDAHDASAISVTPTGDIAATDVQAAIAELDTEKQPASANLTEWSSLNPSANGGSLVTAADYAAMRALLDLEAGTDFLSPAAIAAAYQPLDAQLTDVAGLAVTDGNFIVGNGTNFVGESGNTARTSLGLGTGDSPQFTNETLTGYKDMAEIAAPSNPAANVARFYCKDNGSGTTKLYFRDSAGTETELGAGGGLDIDGLSEDTAPDIAADFLPIYDAGGAANKKTLLSRLKGMKLLASGNTTSGTTIPLTSIPTQYANLALFVSGVSTNGTNTLRVEASDNNGSTYAVTFAGNRILDTTAGTLTTPDVGGSSGAAQTVTGSWFIFGRSGGVHPQTLCSAIYGATLNGTVWGKYATTTAIDALRLNTNGGGTFDAGTYALYGW